MLGALAFIAARGLNNDVYVQVGGGGGGGGWGAGLC